MKHILEKLFGFKKPWYDQVFFYSILLISILAPLLFSFRLKSIFTLPKVYSFTLFSFVAALVIFVKFWKEGGLSIRRSKFNLLIIAYGITLMISTILSVNIYSSLFGMYGRFLGLFILLGLLLLTFFIFNFTREKSEQIAILVSFYIASVVVAVVALVQHYGYVLEQITLSASASRAFGTMGHANHLGGYIVQSIFISSAIFVLVKNKVVRTMILISNIVFILALFQTSSRGAFGALLVCILIVCFSFISLNFQKVEKNLKKFMISSIIAVLLIGGLGFIFKEKIKQVEVIQRTVSNIEFIRQGNVPDRISWIYSSMEMIKDNPLFGSGVSTYQDVYNEYRRLDYRVPGEEQDMIVPHSAHNEYINIAATQGLIALMIYILLIGFVIYKGYKIILDKSEGKSDKEKLVLIFLITSIFAYLIQVLISFGTVSTMIPFFMLLAITHGYTLNLEEKYIESKLKSNSSKDTTLKGGVGISIVLMIVVFTGLNLYIHHRITKADIFLRLTEALHTHPDFEEKGYIYHIDAMKRATIYNPYAYKLYEKKGEFYLRQAVKISRSGETGDFILKAIKAYKKALELNDLHPNTYKDIAISNKYLVDVYKQINVEEKVGERYAAASEAYEKAVELSPNNPLYRSLAAKTYIEMGNYSRALELYLEIAEMRPDYPEIDSIIMGLSEDLSVQ